MQKNWFSLKETQDILHQASSKILIIGDGCKDIYHYGDVIKISQEAPVPIFNLVSTEHKLGMSYNVCTNFDALGANTDLQTYICENKHRYIDRKSKQQVYRVDEKTNNAGKDLNHIGDYDAIVISDYDKGALSYEDIENIISSATVPVFIDTKKTDLGRFKNCVVKINEIEYNNSVSLPDILVVTRGDKDVIVLNEGKVTANFPVTPVDLYDTTGAGDSFLAAFVMYVLATDDLAQSINFAITSSGISITKRGVYAPTLEEICQLD